MAGCVGREVAFCERQGGRQVGWNLGQLTEKKKKKKKKKTLPGTLMADS